MSSDGIPTWRRELSAKEVVKKRYIYLRADRGNKEQICNGKTEGKGRGQKKGSLRSGEGKKWRM